MGLIPESGVTQKKKQSTTLSTVSTVKLPVLVVYADESARKIGWLGSPLYVDRIEIAVVRVAVRRVLKKNPNG